MDYWIAVVDDDAMSLTNAKNLLSEENMRVSCLRSGHDLLKFMKKNAPDLVLLDILMPEMDGFETYRALRELEEQAGKPRVPVIFLTGAEDSETERRGLKAGASDFIHKPFNKDILLRRIQNAVVNTKMIESLTEEATSDQLTGFLNKAAGTRRMAKLCESQTGALLILDLDNFKLVNDLYGHDMGDRILKAFANIVRHNTRVRDVVSRMGGDEFMAFFCNIQEEAAVISLAGRLNEQFSEEASKLMGEDSNIPLGVSVGAVMVPEYGRNYDTLFSLADHSLYAAKQNGKHSAVVYRKKEHVEFSPEDDLQKGLARITRIIEERNEKSEALLLGLEPFSFIYRFLKRFDIRYGGKTGRALFILSGTNPDSEQSLMETAAQFCDLLKKQLRKSDIIFQSRPNQFFLLLPELSEENGDKVVARLLSAWAKEAHSEDVRVDYAIKYDVYEAPSFGAEPPAEESEGSE